MPRPTCTQRAIERINAFFDPLTGGPDGNGWPIGRTVYRSEVIALLASIDGVARVTDFGLKGPCGERAALRQRRCCAPTSWSGPAGTGCVCSAHCHQI